MQSSYDTASGERMVVLNEPGIYAGRTKLILAPRLLKISA